jgi:hypothetical protein
VLSQMMARREHDHFKGSHPCAGGGEAFAHFRLWNDLQHILQLVQDDTATWQTPQTRNRMEMAMQHTDLDVAGVKLAKRFYADHCAVLFVGLWVGGLAPPPTEAGHFSSQSCYKDEGSWLLDRQQNEGSEQSHRQ